MSENVQQILDSFSLSSKFNTGVVSADRLLPSPYKRAQTFYLNTWREIASGPTLDWDSREHSFEFPASIRLASSMFLEVKLPACGSGNWIANAGQHLIRSMKIKSGSRTPVHYDDYAVILRDYLASLSNEAHACFCDAYLGGFQEGGSETSTARTLYTYSSTTISLFAP
jgi:hypothetical protein